MCMKIPRLGLKVAIRLVGVSSHCLSLICSWWMEHQLVVVFWTCFGRRERDEPQKSWSPNKTTLSIPRMIANETNRRDLAGRTFESLRKKSTCKFYAQVAGEEALKNAEEADQFA